MFGSLLSLGFSEFKPEVDHEINVTHHVWDIDDYCLTKEFILVLELPLSNLLTNCNNKAFG